MHLFIVCALGHIGGSQRTPCRVSCITGGRDKIVLQKGIVGISCVDRKHFRSLIYNHVFSMNCSISSSWGMGHISPPLEPRGSWEWQGAVLSGLFCLCWAFQSWHSGTALQPPHFHSISHRWLQKEPWPSTLSNLRRNVHSVFWRYTTHPNPFNVHHSIFISICGWHWPDIPRDCQEPKQPGPNLY